MGKGIRFRVLTGVRNCSFSDNLCERGIDKGFEPIPHPWAADNVAGAPLRQRVPDLASSRRLSRRGHHVRMLLRPSGSGHGVAGVLEYPAGRRGLARTLGVRRLGKGLGVKPGLCLVSNCCCVTVWEFGGTRYELRKTQSTPQKCWHFVALGLMCPGTLRPRAPCPAILWSAPVRGCDQNMAPIENCVTACNRNPWVYG